MLLADTMARLHLARMSRERAQRGGTLGAELRASQALSRFLSRPPDVGEAAGVRPAVFQRTLETDLALAQMARAVGEIEATSAIGEMILSARRPS